MRFGHRRWCCTRAATPSHRLQKDILAAGIPGAQFVELDSNNHILLENEPAWKRFCDEVSGS